MAGKLENYLYNSTINKDNFNSLLALYKNNASLFLAFIGAGISSSIEGIPDLKKLYASWCKKHGCSENSDEELPELFSSLYDQIVNKENFDKELFDAVIPKNTRSTAAHLEIARAFNCFVTTNYYDPIEDGFKQKQDFMNAKPEELTRYHFVFPPKEKAKYSLTYLHGNSDVGFCILRKKDYQYFYPSLYESNAGIYAVENSLSNILTQRTVVFLGASLESHLRKYLQYLLAKLKKENSSKLDAGQKREVKTHYWITGDSGIKKYLESAPKEMKNEFEEKYFNDYKEINIEPILYTGGHIFIEDLCKTLTKLRELNPTSVAGSTYDPSQRQGDL